MRIFYLPLILLLAGCATIVNDPMIPVTLSLATAAKAPAI